MRIRVALLTGALVVGLSYVAATQALGSGLPRCDRHAADATARAGQVSGTGERVVVIGDSWSVGLGLAKPAGSWPSRLDGRVHVAGFSGSGFSALASPCGRVSFADRAGAVVTGADLVVVEGGLNDWDHSDWEIRAGYARLMRVLRAADVPRVVVVGPASAPSRAARVPHVDALLADLSEGYGVDYVSTVGLDLDYLDDRLHLTASGHAAFGDYVERRLAGLRHPS
ncbi:SGNH/GDSL hydrolase family protein [Nocardioides dilutus]